MSLPSPPKSLSTQEFKDGGNPVFNSRFNQFYWFREQLRVDYRAVRIDSRYDWRSDIRKRPQQLADLHIDVPEGSRAVIRIVFTRKPKADNKTEESIESVTKKQKIRVRVYEVNNDKKTGLMVGRSVGATNVRI